MLKHYVLGKILDLNFPEKKLAIEGHKDIKKTKEDEREKVLKEKLGCEIIRVSPDEKDFGMYVEIGKIYNCIIKSTKKSLIAKLPN